MDGVVGVVQKRNPNVCTEVVGSIVGSPSPTSSPSAVEKDEKQKERLTAICTLDGQQPGDYVYWDGIYTVLHTEGGALGLSPSSLSPPRIRGFPPSFFPQRRSPITKSTREVFLFNW